MKAIALVEVVVIWLVGKFRQFSLFFHTEVGTIAEASYFLAPDFEIIDKGDL